jgi:hypothetical protein
MCIERAWLSLERRHEDRGQLLQRGKLIGAEEALSSFRNQVDIGYRKLRGISRLLRALASGGVGRRSRMLRLRGGERGDGRCNHQILDKSSTFHK